MNKKDIIILGIETSCDETSIAIVKNGREVLYSLISSQVDIHQEFGGVVPEIASRNHLEAIVPLIDQALKGCVLSLKEIDAIAVVHGPGLVGALLVGVAAAKALSFALEIPLIAVNHIEGHVFANFISNCELTPPFLALVVSGGHTLLLEIKTYDEFVLLGTTRDDAAGEAFDKVARLLGKKYPGGPEIEKLAQSGNAQAIHFPRIVDSIGDYEFSFSGLKSSVINYINKQKNSGLTINEADIAASFQVAAVETLILKVEKAAKRLNYKKIVLAGGVAANKLLRDSLQRLCLKNNWHWYAPSFRLCTDNAEMVACRAYYQYLQNDFADSTLNAMPSLQLKQLKPEKGENL